MNKVSVHIGGRIRMYRKARGMTLQQLADSIHKSRASVSKYENGEITLDVETLFEIAQVLMVSPSQLMDVRPLDAQKRGNIPEPLCQKSVLSSETFVFLFL